MPNPSVLVLLSKASLIMVMLQVVTDALYLAKDFGSVVRSRNPPKLSSSELDVAASTCIRQPRPNSK